MLHTVHIHSLGCDRLRVAAFNLQRRRHRANRKRIMNLVLVNPSASSTSSAAATALTVEDVAAQVKYRGNKVYNLDPQYVLSVTEREALSIELSPAIAKIRLELVKQQNRIIEAFSEKSKLRKAQFPAGSPLDYAQAGYSDLESDLEDIFIETLDLEDLIAKGIPVVIVKARLRQIRANLKVVIAFLNVSLVNIKWRELLEGATEHRNWRMPFEERIDTNNIWKRKYGAAAVAAEEERNN